MDSGAEVHGISGRAVLVTGASRGIGKATALAFAKVGDRVVVNHRDSRAEADEVVRSLPGSGHTAIQADLAIPESAAALVESTVAALGGLDVLVNNAGVSLPHDVAVDDFETWRAAWDRTLAVNLSGPAFVTYWAVQQMLKQGGGRIINISSRGAFRGEPGQPAYAATKAGLNAFGQSLALALGGRGIAVMTIAPGWVETEMAIAEMERPGGQEVLKQSPLGRMARPDEIAAAAVFLASPEAEFSTGAVLDINGASYLRT
ncbi:MAG TPA: SDR family oxidoreductase [Candidatus Dormibacteraeota bacterium]|nr:SDR family oxidoreductase [Candidatus Dormibacteraeota bacterium]